MVGGGDGVDEGGGIVGGCVRYLLFHCGGGHCLYWEGCWVRGVQLQCDVFARMGEVPSRQVGGGVEWRGEGGVRRVDTSISHVMLCGSSFVGNRGGQCGLWVRLERGVGDFQP